MLDITKQDIESLNDEDLRNLIGRLCEVELYTLGNTTHAVSYGGNQDEKDDGIDVEVNASKIIDDECFILRNNTIFQAKKPPMPPSKIQKEMKNKDGSIRECLLNLDKSGGAYIIVSSGDDLAPPTYSSRIKAMNEVLEEFKIKNVKVDFYDCNKIATWVRNYPSLICWVNDLNKKGTNGWTSYCNWSNRGTSEKPFIVGENSVIYYNDFNKDNKIDLIDGINQIRNILSTEKGSVRLAGLSGVGKTRFAQALFDDSIGENALNKEMVIYGDVGDSLFPEPITFIHQLQKMNKKIILVVDNCEATMHNKLTELCQRENSQISLMTIEYDVKDDDNVDSNNYYLSTTSDVILTQLLKRDYKDVSDRNIDTIVKCSNGNFRIAIYLARSIANQKDIGVLKSDELFNRLFYQGSNIDEEMLKIGEVCSLFYSFNITVDLLDRTNELNIISSLVSMDPLSVYRKVEELRARQIVQKRGDMRAVLPHALANKLSIDFLKKYPWQHILGIVNQNARLALSFFRRLKFLHLSDEAQLIVKSFLKEIDIDNLVKSNEVLLEKISCITILNPELVLQRIEEIEDCDFFSRDNKKFYEWVRILSYIAYDEKLFKRAIKLIIRFALTEKSNENYNSIRSILYNFFHLYLSYTHAPLSLRLEIITELLQSSNSNMNDLGIKLVDEILKSGFFVGAPIYDCGSQIKDYGLEPNPNDWYTEALNYCRNLLHNNIFYDDIKNVLANNFRNLASIGYYHLLEEIVEENLTICSWPRIWISLLTIKHFDSDKVPEDMMHCMNLLINKVKPVTISDKIDTFLCKGKKIYLELDDTTDDYESIDNMVFNLGREIAQDVHHIKEYLMLLDDTCNLYRIHFLVKGICADYSSKEDLIYMLLELISDNNKKIVKEMLHTVIALFHEENRGACSTMLDELSKDIRYNKYFCALQMSYKLSEKDVFRLKKVIKSGIIDENDLCRMDWYITELPSKCIIDFFECLPNTYIIQSSVLSALFRICESKKIDDDLKAYIRRKIANIDYSKLNDSNHIHDEYVISNLINHSFSVQSGEEEAKLIFNKINLLLQVKWLSFYKFEKILVPLIKLYPKTFLSIFVSFDGEPKWEKRSFFRKSHNLNNNIISFIDDDIVIEWIQETRKIEEISYLMEPYYYDNEKECYTWTKLGNYVISKYFDNELIMKNIISQVYPNSWSEEYSTVLKKRVNLFVEMKNNDNQVIAEIGEMQYNIILKRIDYSLRKEKEENEKSFNSFE